MAVSTACIMNMPARRLASGWKRRMSHITIHRKATSAAGISSA